MQKALDQANGLHLKPQRAPFEEARAHKIGHSTADQTVPEKTQQRRGRSATETATRSMHDDRMQAEATFRSRAGLKCYITRKTDGKCCEWCSAMAGRYEYHSEPKDVYRRHDNCGCSVTYENGRQRQDVWSKREWEAPEPGAGAGDAVVLTKEQAEKLQAEHGLTVSKKRSIIKAITVQDFEKSDPNGVISDECKNVIVDTLKSQGVSFVYDEVRIVQIPRDKDGKIEPLRTVAIANPGYPVVVLEINETYFAGRSLEKINKMFKAQSYSAADSLEEAIIHECAHAKVLKGKRYSEFKAIDDELKDGTKFTKPIEGREDGKSLKDLAGEISEYAQKDGLECIAECHVIIHRGTKIANELKSFHDEFIQ